MEKNMKTDTLFRKIINLSILENYNFEKGLPAKSLQGHFQLSEHFFKGWLSTQAAFFYFIFQLLDIKLILSKLLKKIKYNFFE